MLSGLSYVFCELESAHANLLNIIALRSKNRCFYGLSLIVLNSWRGLTPSHDRPGLERHRKSQSELKLLLGGLFLKGDGKGLLLF